MYIIGLTLLTFIVTLILTLIVLELFEEKFASRFILNKRNPLVPSENL